MKKLTLCTGLVLALALAVAPFVTGLIIKAEMRDTLALINQNTGYEVEEISYKLGWKSSTQVVDLRLQALSPDADLADLDPEMLALLENSKVRLTTAIEHGPFLSQGLGWMAWHSQTDDGTLRQWLTWDAEQPLYQNRGIARLNRDLEFTETIPELRAASDDHRFAFGGYRGSGQTIDGQTSYRGQSGSAEIYTADGGQLHLDPFAIRMDMNASLQHALSGSLYDTQIAIDFPLVQINGIQTAEIHDLQIAAEVQMQPHTDLADMLVSYKIGALEAGEISFSDAVLEIALENYSDEFQRHYMQFATASLGADPLKSQEFLAQALPLLLREGPGLSLRQFAVTLPEGRLESQIRIKLDPIADPPADLSNPLFWPDKVLATASLSADRAVAQRIAGRITQYQMANMLKDLDAQTRKNSIDTQALNSLAMLESMGILTATNQGYSADFKYDHGHTLVNGQPFQIPLGAFSP